MPFAKSWSSNKSMKSDNCEACAYHYSANNVAKNIKLEKSISRKLLCPKTKVPFIYSANNRLT
ncbi:MAG: hypothetical protein ACEY3H_06320, partial [Wolbachia sp.]